MWPWAIAFWLFDENQAWLMYNVDHKTHVVAEAQLPCVGEHLVDITVIQWANTFKDLGIRCPYTLFLALKSSLFSPSWMGNKGRLALAVDLDKRCLTLNCRLTSCFITTKWGLIRLRDKTVTILTDRAEVFCPGARLKVLLSELLRLVSCLRGRGVVGSIQGKHCWDRGKELWWMLSPNRVVSWSPCSCAQLFVSRVALQGFPQLWGSAVGWRESSAMLSCLLYTAHLTSEEFLLLLYF